MGVRVDKESRWLFIPVEVKVRELLAKTLLACKAAERGYKVVLGEAHTVRDALHLLPAGILLEKGVAPAPIECFKRFRDLGNSVVAWCEEGLVYFDDDDYIRRKVTKEDLESLEVFFAWGRYHADVILTNFPAMKNRIICSGNPRFDLLRPEFRSFFESETAELQNDIGPFILVNTNFSHCNHKKGKNGYVDLLKKAGKITNKEEEDFAQKWMAHKRRLFDSFIPMISRISHDFKEYKIIVRPHPGENHEFWRELYKSEPNILVTHSGGVIPWILASSVLVHNGCTTGIEAALLGHPAIAYRPVVSDTYDQYLPNSVNIQADNEGQLIERLEKLLNDQEIDLFVKSENWNNILAHHISGIDEKSSCSIILDKLDSIHKNIVAINRRPWYWLHRLDLKLYLDFNSLVNKILVGSKDRGEYSEHKFSKLYLDELKGLITELYDSSSKNHCVEAQQLDQNLFLLQKI